MPRQGEGSAAQVAGAGRRGSALLTLAAAAAVAAPLAASGGFYAGGQIAFVALAGVALCVAVAVSGPAVGAAWQAAPVAALLALAAITLVACAWTPAPTAEGVRAALVVGAYAAMALVGGALGVQPVAVLLALAAAGSGAVGLTAAAVRALPDAEVIDHAWRPGGPFEYPPTLALLQVCALVPLARGALSVRRGVAAPSGLGLGIAALVLGLSGSQWGLALTVLVLLAAVAAPERVLGVGVGRALPAIVAASAAGVAVQLAILRGLGGFDRQTPVPRLVLFAVLAASVPVALRLRPEWPVTSRSARRAVAGLLLAAALLAVLLPARPVHLGNVLHGRAQLWRSAMDTALDRPLRGAGASSYFIASRSHPTAQTPRFAHSLPLEVWVEEGGLGLAAVIVLLATTGRLVRRTWSRPAAALLIPCAGAFLLGNLVDWSWHQPCLGALWALSVGALIAEAREG